MRYIVGVFLAIAFIWLCLFDNEEFRQEENLTDEERYWA